VSKTSYRRWESTTHSTQSSAALGQFQDERALHTAVRSLEPISLSRRSLRPPLWLNETPPPCNLPLMVFLCYGSSVFFDRRFLCAIMWWKYDWFSTWFSTFEIYCKKIKSCTVLLQVQYVGFERLSHGHDSKMRENFFFLLFPDRRQSLLLLRLQIPLFLFLV
jgi:hypothetical protein